MLKRGGGSLASALQASAGRAQRAVVDAVRPLMEDLMDGAEAQWPVGPERPWEPNHVHSQTLFVLEDQSRGWFVRLVILNRADYALFIHRPGNKTRLVSRELLIIPLDDLQPRIEAAARGAIERAYRDSGISR